MQYIKNLELYNLMPEITALSEELLQQKAFLAKYHLSTLALLVKPFFDSLEESKNELIKKYGEDNKEGGLSVEPTIDGGVENPKYKEFMEEFKPILETEVEINYSIPLSAYENVETTNFYPNFYKFLKG